RASWSVLPPAAYGTMMRIGWFGNPCASAAEDKNSRLAAASSARHVELRADMRQASFVRVVNVTVESINRREPPPNSAARDPCGGGSAPPPWPHRGSGCAAAAGDARAPTF